MLEEGSDSKKEEDGNYSSVVSSLKKRKQQRKEQKDFDKKAWSGNGGGNDEKFEMQAAAANRQIAVTEGKNMIEFLRIAQESSVWDRSELKDMFLSAKNSIFGESNEPAGRDEPGLVNNSYPSNDVDSDGEDIHN